MMVLVFKNSSVESILEKSPVHFNFDDVFLLFKWTLAEVELGEVEFSKGPGCHVTGSSHVLKMQHNLLLQEDKDSCFWPGGFRAPGCA